VAWIPGIFLAEAVLFVGMGIATYEPVLTIHVHQQEAVVFRVKDTDESDSARCDYDGTLPGVIRPLLCVGHNLHPAR
jgi:lipopolysaccharide transport system ATP-binding protein